MPAKFFCDSNVILEMLGPPLPKREIALDLFDTGPVLSTQVLSECANVCLKKLKLSASFVKNFLSELTAGADVLPINEEAIQKAIDLHIRYHFSFYDSLIIAAALLSHCELLYSEDMQHGQVLEGLTIVNPFLPSP